jgi:hypothetical protein
MHILQCNENGHEEPSVLESGVRMQLLPGGTWISGEARKLAYERIVRQQFCYRGAQRLHSRDHCCLHRSREMQPQVEPSVHMAADRAATQVQLPHWPTKAFVIRSSQRLCHRLLRDKVRTGGRARGNA